jgi:hypothetical protein
MGYMKRFPQQMGMKYVEGHPSYYVEDQLPMIVQKENRPELDQKICRGYMHYWLGYMVSAAIPDAAADPKYSAMRLEAT